MYRTVFSAALAASLLGITGAAYADPPWERPGVEHREREREVRREERRDELRDERRDERIEHREFERRHAWARGERFVFEPGRFEVVQNWEVMALPRPAWGYHWVHVPGNFLLVNNATGVVLDVRFARF
jgi:Ni/Co efflux regulator RcnB